MLSLIFTWLIVAWGILSCIYMLRCAWTRFPKRDADDVIPFLYPVDISLAESLLDPATDFEFRWNLRPPQFRDAQRKGFHDGIEGARKDFQNHRPPNVENRDEYRHPSVSHDLRGDYRDGFRAGYERAMSHLNSPHY